VVIADIDEDEASRVSEESSLSVGSEVQVVGVDVRDHSAMSGLVDSVVADHGRIDFMFNNAGIAIAGPAVAMDRAHWERIIDVNLRGVVNGILAAYPVMVQQKSGHILNTASITGLVPTPVLTAYATTKHAVVGLSLSLRAEAAVHDVRVSVICPGFVDTPMLTKGNPPDLPLVPGAPDALGGTQLSKIAYSPDRLAAHVLFGAVRNRPIIVAPASARAIWLAYRVAPRTMIKLASLGMQRSTKGPSKGS
jgi:NAD(P)-dependent dehydrogenase (short-subunit alcohol dehydrogenase family)